MKTKFDDEGCETFMKYYNNWIEETAVLSTGQFANQWFKKICNINETPIWETVRGIKRVLDDHDDYIAYALEIAYSNFTSQELFDYTGYVSLEDYCNTCRIVLNAILEYDDEEKILENSDID